MTHNGQWKISVRKSSWDHAKDQNTNDISVGRYEPDLGKWTDWVVHVRWSGDPAKGLLEIWKNGQLVHNAQGQNKFNDGQGNYMKFGIYKWCWKPIKRPNGTITDQCGSDTSQRVIYYDELRIADHRGSYNAVAPGTSLSKLDHLTLYRPGTGTIWILRNNAGAFAPVFAEGSPGNGIGGYDLADPADRVFAFDYDA
jgi:hypothetical protein